MKKKKKSLHPKPKAIMSFTSHWQEHVWLVDFVYRSTLGLRVINKHQTVLFRGLAGVRLRQTLAEQGP